jgi:hypothetical protein
MKDIRQAALRVCKCVLLGMAVCQVEVFRFADLIYSMQASNTMQVSEFCQSRVFFCPVHRVSGSQVSWDEDWLLFRNLNLC